MVTRIDPRSGALYVKHRHRPGDHRSPAARRRAGPRGELPRGRPHQGLCGGGPPHHPRHPGGHFPHPSTAWCKPPVRAGGARDLRRRGGGPLHRPGGRAAAPRWPSGPTIRTWIPSAPAWAPAGQRVNAIVEELQRGKGGHHQVISEDPAEYHRPPPCLPPTCVDVRCNPEESKTCRVVVPDDQLSLAIGKEGQNARLAAKLTGYKIDIKSDIQRRRGGRGRTAGCGGAGGGRPAGGGQQCAVG